MKKIIGGSLFVLSLCLALLVVTTQTAAENPKFETISGTMTLDSLIFLGEGWFDGAGNEHRRGWLFGFDISSEDLRLKDATAVDEFNMNGFAHSPGDAKIWGRLWITQTDGGVWEGSWTGKMIGGQQIVKAVAKGTGGSIDGKKLRMSLIQQPMSSPSIFDFSGVIH